MSKNVVSSSPHPIPSATAKQRPFHLPFRRRLEVTAARGGCTGNESAFLQPWSSGWQRAVGLARGTKPRGPQLCGFVCRDVHNLSNTVFPLLPDGGVRTRVSTARKGVLEGLYSSASALWVNAGRFIGISPPFMFFFPLFIFAGAQENQTNPKPQIFVIV